MRSFGKWLRFFIMEWKCIPSFLTRRFSLLISVSFRARYGLFLSKTYSSRTKKRKRPAVTFVIPHKDCSTFLRLCIESIHAQARQLDYQILVADDCSDEEEFARAKGLVSDMVSVTRFHSPKGHPFALEWLYGRARSKYVVILDQDAMLLSGKWMDFLEDFRSDSDLLVVGLRDKFINRYSPEMLHPAFLILDKERCDQRLTHPFFFGDRPGYGNYQVHVEEPYHALTCKALACSPKSVRYLESHQTKYGFGSVGYCGVAEARVVYHQWYSGRIKTLKDDDLIDNIPVSRVRAPVSMFLEDYKNGAVDLRPVHYPSCEDVFGPNP